jgi:hypothetical protein
MPDWLRRMLAPSSLSASFFGPVGREAVLVSRSPFQKRVYASGLSKGH